MKNRKQTQPEQTSRPPAGCHQPGQDLLLHQPLLLGRNGPAGHGQERILGKFRLAIPEPVPGDDKRQGVKFFPEPAGPGCVAKPPARVGADAHIRPEGSGPERLVCTYHPTVPTPQVPGRCGHRPLRVSAGFAAERGQPNISGVPSTPVPGSARSTLGRHRGLCSAQAPFKQKADRLGDLLFF